MKVLLDTHAFLWFGLNHARLSEVARETVRDPATDARLSIASLWELAIKVRLGKITLDLPFGEFVSQALERIGLEIVPIERSHLRLIAELPMHHRDPFDRMLVAQALVEGMAVVSGDEDLDAYGVQRVW